MVRWVVAVGVLLALVPASVVSLQGPSRRHHHATVAPESSAVATDLQDYVRSAASGGCCGGQPTANVPGFLLIYDDLCRDGESVEECCARVTEPCFRAAPIGAGCTDAFFGYVVPFPDLVASHQLNCRLGGCATCAAHNVSLP